VALTNKLLRMVNSAHFRHAGGGTISTVSRAVALIGFAGVRNLALSLVLLEHMQNKQHASQLKEEFLRALMAGTLAGALAPLARETEETFIGALFQNLGRLLTEFYFPEEAQQIRLLGEQGTERDAAAQRVLGLGLQDLAVGRGPAWGLPDSLQRVMRTPTARCLPAPWSAASSACAGSAAVPTRSPTPAAHGPEEGQRPWPSWPSATAARWASSRGTSSAPPPTHANGWSTLPGDGRRRGPRHGRAAALSRRCDADPAGRRRHAAAGQRRGGTPWRLRSPEAVTAALTAGIADVTQHLAATTSSSTTCCAWCCRPCSRRWACSAWCSACATPRPTR
jgi:hypothetical protein